MINCRPEFHRKPSSAAPILGGAGYAGVPSCPPKSRGAERRSALVRKRRTRDPPRGRADPWIARDRQPMTPAGCAFRRSTAAFPAEPLVPHQPRAALPGTRHWRRARPASSLRGGPSAAGRSPGAARVLGYEPSPQGPPLAPSSGSSLEDTPRRASWGIYT